MPVRIGRYCPCVGKLNSKQASKPPARGHARSFFWGGAFTIGQQRSAPPKKPRARRSFFFVHKPHHPPGSAAPPPPPTAGLARRPPRLRARRVWMSQCTHPHWVVFWPCPPPPVATGRPARPQPMKQHPPLLRRRNPPRSCCWSRKPHCCWSQSRIAVGLGAALLLVSEPHCCWH
jgi:hypothetical protein